MEFPTVLFVAVRVTVNAREILDSSVRKLGESNMVIKIAYDVKNLK
jgi:hypothetical protein